MTEGIEYVKHEGPAIVFMLNKLLDKGLEERARAVKDVERINDLYQRYTKRGDAKQVAKQKRKMQEAMRRLHGADSYIAECKDKIRRANEVQATAEKSDTPAPGVGFPVVVPPVPVG